MGPRAGLHVLEKRNLFPVPILAPQIVLSVGAPTTLPRLRIAYKRAVLSVLYVYMYFNVCSHTAFVHTVPPFEDGHLMAETYWICVKGFFLN